MANTNKSTTLVLSILLAAVAAVAVVYFLQQPRSMEDRMDSAAEQLSEGNLGNALENLGNETNGQQLQSDLENAAESMDPNNQ